MQLRKYDLKDLEDIDDLQSKVKQVRLVKKLGKQGYRYDLKELFEPITKPVTDSNRKLLEDTKSKTKAIENLEESNKYIITLKSTDKKEVIHSILIRPIAKPLVPKNKRQFRLLDDPDSDNWNDYKMNGEKVTLYDDKLHFGDTGVVFTLKADVLSMITDYDFNKTESPDGKQINNFLDEIHFNIRATGKSNRDRTLIINYYNKRSILASGLRTVFFSENPYELCDRLKLLIQEKRAGNISNIIKEEIVAIFDKLLEYISITASEHKKT